MATNYPIQVTIGASVATSLGYALKEAQNGIDRLGKSLDEMSGKKADIDRLSALKQQAIEAGKAWRDAQNKVRALHQQKADGSLSSKGLDNAKARVGRAQERLSESGLSDKEREKLQAQLTKAQASLAANQAKVDSKFSSDLERAAQAAAVAKDKFTQTKSAADSLSKSMQAAGTDTKRLADESIKLGSALASLQQKTESLAKAQSNQASNLEARNLFRAQAMDVVALGASLYGVMKPAIEFESVMADVGKVVNFDSSDEFKQMGKDIQVMSTHIPMAAQGLGDIMAAAGQAGIAKSELRQFTEDAAKMGVAFDISGKEAGAAMTGLRSIFHLSQTDVVSLGDAFNHLSNNMDAKARDMLNISNRAGSMATMFGLTGEQLGALSATFLALKSPPDVAATGINAMMLKMATADKQNAKFQEGLSAIGMSAETMKQMIGENAQGALLSFLKAVKQAPDVMGTLSDLFGLEYADDIAKLVNGLDTYEKSLQLIGDKSQYAGSMQKEFETRSATTANHLQLLQNNMTRLGVTIGSILLPALNSVIGVFMPVIDGLVSLAERFPIVTKVVVGGISALIAYKIATIGLGYAWTFIKAPFLAASVAFAKARLGLALLQTQITATAGSSGVLAVLWARMQASATALVAPIRAASMAFWSMLPAIGATTAALFANPITWIVIGIGAAVAGLALVIRKYLDPISAYIGGVFNGIKTVMQPAIDSLSTALAPLAPIGAVLGATFGWIANGLSGIVNWFAQLLAPVTMTTDQFNTLSESGNRVGMVIGGVLSAAFTILSFPIRAVGTLVGWVIDGFNVLASFSPLSMFMVAWQPVADFMTSLWSGISAIVGQAIDWIISKISFVTDKASALGKVVKSFFSSDEKQQSTAPQISESNALKPSPSAIDMSRQPVKGQQSTLSKLGESQIVASPQVGMPQVGMPQVGMPRVGMPRVEMPQVGDMMSKISMAQLSKPQMLDMCAQPVSRNQAITHSTTLNAPITIHTTGNSDAQTIAALVDARVRAVLKDAQRSHSGMLYD